MKLPDQFQAALINLEIDFEGKGGIQRFKTVGEFQAWLDREKSFWGWLEQSPASNQTRNLGDVFTSFNQLQQECRTHLSQADQKWQQILPRITQHVAIQANEEKPENDRQNAAREVEQRTAELRNALEQLRGSLASIVKREIVQTKNYLPSTDPPAQFLKEFAASNPAEAVYALDQILLEERGANHQRQAEHAGRLMATLYRKNLNRKFRDDQQAFKNAITSWSKELADFKERYEVQEEEFQEISARHAAADEAWKERSDQMAEEFGEMRKGKEDDLNNLKTTFETHMQLKGPLIYWREKRREHTIGKKRMAWASGVSGVLGAVAIAGAAYLFLPKETAPEIVPWRNIGLFLFISTFVLWLVRLLVKLMLSHIHLATDAREREVMISTFMALMRRQESRDGVAKMDLALVLAPIFKPSTTGVIKDDGGPTTLTDFISRLAGK